MALQTIGESLIVNSGIEAFANAHANGGSMKPKYYLCISEDIELSVSLTAADIHGWGQHDIDFYHVVDGNSVQYTIDIPTNRSLEYIRAVALFFEDGTLYAVAKPVQVLPAGIHNTFTFELKVLNQASMLDFSYISPDDRGVMKYADSINDLTEALFMSGVKMVYVPSYGVYLFDDTQKNVNNKYDIINGWVLDDTDTHKERFLVFGDWQPMGAKDDPQATAAVDFLHTVLDDMKTKHITGQRGEINCIFAGDVVDRAYGRDYDNDGGLTDNALYTYEAAYSDLIGLGFDHEYTIAGNHDVDGRAYSRDHTPVAQSYELYEQYFGKRTYHVVRGNNLFIFLSPTSHSVRGAYSDETFEYWKSLVLNNNDKNIFTTTHHPLHDVPNGNDENYDPQNEAYWYVNDSKRFIDVLTAKHSELEKGIVDNHVAWFYGHIGGDRHTYKYGTQFINGGMHLTAPKNDKLTYWVLDLQDKSASITAKLYDYWGDSSLADGAVGGVDGKFIETLNIVLKYEYKKNDFYFDSRWVDMATDDNIPKLQLNQASHDGNGVANTIDFIEKGTRDEEDLNLTKGHGYGEIGRVAGGFGSVPVGSKAKGIDGGYFNTTSGVGGGWAVVRLSNSEDDFSCKMVLFASDERRGKDSLVPVIEIYPDGRMVLEDKVMYAKEFFSKVGSNASRLTDNILRLFSNYGENTQKDVSFNLYDSGAAWAFSMNDHLGNELPGSNMRYTQETQTLTLGGKNIIVHKQGSSYTTTTPVNADISSANICGDSSVGIEYVYARCERFGEVAFIEIRFKINGFSVDIPSDIGFDFNFDIGRIAIEKGWFKNIIRAPYGLASYQFYKDGGNDTPIQSCFMTVRDKDDVVKPNSLYFKQSECMAINTNTVDRLEVRTTLTVRVED